MLISLSISVSCFLCAQMGSNVHTVQVLMSVCARVRVCERARWHASPAAISLPLMLGVDGCADCEFDHHGKHGEIYAGVEHGHAHTHTPKSPLASAL